MKFIVVVLVMVLMTLVSALAGDTFRVKMMLEGEGPVSTGLRAKTMDDAVAEARKMMIKKRAHVKVLGVEIMKSTDGAAHVPVCKIGEMNESQAVACPEEAASGMRIPSPKLESVKSE